MIPPSLKVSLKVSSAQNIPLAQGFLLRISRYNTHYIVSAL